MNPLVATVRAHVEAGNLEPTLAAAIDAWRAKRAPVLAELVDARELERSTPRTTGGARSGRR